MPWSRAVYCVLILEVWRGTAVVYRVVVYIRFKQRHSSRSKVLRSSNQQNRCTPNCRPAQPGRSRKIVKFELDYAQCGMSSVMITLSDGKQTLQDWVYLVKLSSWPKRHGRPTLSYVDGIGIAFNQRCRVIGRPCTHTRPGIGIPIYDMSTCTHVLPVCRVHLS